MIISTLVHTAVWPVRGVGALARLVAVQVSVLGLYLPPWFVTKRPSNPPQMIISTPVHTALWSARGVGALARLVAVQVSVFGLYLPPVFR
jgi:hypothetical protein